jgi:hypothetical protein
MKKVIPVIFVAILLFSGLAVADSIPDNSHYVDRDVKVVNLGEFPEITLIGVSNHPGDWATIDELYEITPQTSLHKGYKFNSFKVYAVDKKYFDTVGYIDLKTQRVKKPGNCPKGKCFKEVIVDENALISNIDIEPEGNYVDNSNPLASEDYEYTIAGFSGAKFILYKSKEILKYNDGRADEVKTFDRPNIPDLRLTLKRGNVPNQAGK